MPTPRSYIAAIGIDAYRGRTDADWPPLGNAVSDALGATEAFGKLGFVEAVPPLLDERATRDAIDRLVVDDLRGLSPDDSLVIFFAGHGRTVTQPFAGGSKLGYLIPVDGAGGEREIASWIRVDNWLRDVAELAPRHIFVILDACHSGIAIDAFDRQRALTPVHDRLERLALRRSRRILTSARATEEARDDGPIAAHSLFTGVLIEALGGALAAATNQPRATVTALAGFVTARVRGAEGAAQTPDVGAFLHDDKGELVFQLRAESRAPVATPVVVRPADAAPLFARQLDRHDADRAHGELVLTVLAGEPASALAAWGVWAAQRSELVVVVDAAGESVVDEVLAAMPWMRLVLAARAKLSGVAHVPPDALDASIDARGVREWRTFVAEAAGLDRVALVAGWLLAAVRGPRGPDVSTAPLHGEALVAALCALAPIALAVRPAGESDAVARAIRAAVELAELAPRRPVAMLAPSDIAATLQRGPDSSSMSLARQGIVPIAPKSAKSSRATPAPADVLHAALERDPRTRGLFAVAGQAELVAQRLRLGVRIDRWYRSADAGAFAAERARDAERQKSLGIQISRFLVDDVEERLPLVVDEIAIWLGGFR